MVIREIEKKKDMKVGEVFVVGEVSRGIGNGYDHCIYKIIVYRNIYVNIMYIDGYTLCVCIYMDIYCIYNCQRINKNVF